MLQVCEYQSKSILAATKINTTFICFVPIVKAPLTWVVMVTIGIRCSGGQAILWVRGVVTKGCGHGGVATKVEGGAMDGPHCSQFVVGGRGKSGGRGEVHVVGGGGRLHGCGNLSYKETRLVWVISHGLK